MASADAAADSTAVLLPSSATADTRLPSTLTPDSSTDSSDGHLNTRGSIRRKLSKQKVVEETEANSSPLPLLEESFASEKAPAEKEDSPTGMNSRSRQLVRGLALCGDDDTRLRPPPPAALQRHSNSLSRDSSGTEYTDSSGVDLKAFVIATLHKNPRDRQMALQLEQQLTMFVNDQSVQSYKFPEMSSYNRMLIHRISAIFGLDHNIDNSGKCVVVNKTDRTGRPDFDFGSLIHTAQFSDFSHHGHHHHHSRKPYRAVQSVDETRDPTLLGYGYGTRSVDCWYNPSRKPRSFDTPYMSQNGSPQHNQYYYHNGTHSIDVPHAQYNVDRTAMLRKAGSFGGTPAYYRSGNSMDNGERVRDAYSSHGSMGSPANVAELSDGMAHMQIETPPRVPVPVPREYVYNYGYHHQPVYVNPSAMSSPGGAPYGSNYIVSTTVHQVTIPPPTSVTYVAPPQAAYYSHSYSDAPEYAAIPLSSNYAYAQQSPSFPLPYVMPQAYYECAEYPNDPIVLPPVENSHQESSQPPAQTAMTNPPLSMDRGYGSLTNQDSLREETEYAE